MWNSPRKSLLLRCRIPGLRLLLLTICVPVDNDRKVGRESPPTDTVSKWFVCRPTSSVVTSVSGTYSRN